MAFEFGIRAWAASAPALQSPDAWRAWSHAPWVPTGTELPQLAHMAPMLRRRVNALGRAALHPAYACLPQDYADAATDAATDAHVPAPRTAMPMVFASRHGDTARAFDMLTELASDQPLSPTAFGLSVHNAVGAMFSIDQADTANLQAIAAGRDTVEAAVVEACGLLADGAPEVLLVCYDAPLPEPYVPFADEPDCLYGWCWRIGAPRAGEPAWQLEYEADVGDAAGHAAEARPGEAAALLPHGLDVLRFMLTAAPELRYRGERAVWRWRRHG